MNRITESNPPWMGEEMWVSAREPDDEMMEEVYCKLWSYENTGLEPEEIHPSAYRWITVKDRLPEDDENLRFYDDGHIRFTSVLVHDENRGTAIANRLMIRHHSMPALDELATDGWVWSRPYEPTHWMPLPELPKEETPQKA